MAFFDTRTFALATLIPGAALAQMTFGQPIGTSEDEIRANLQRQGYTVTYIEVELDEIEVEAIKDGVEYEIELAANGTITAFDRED